jgi:Transposase and inactivated derivatives
MNHPKMNHIYIGIDCHKHTHTAAIINCFNEELGMITFDNIKKGFNDLDKLVNEVTDKVKGVTPIFGLEDVKHFGHSLSNYLLDKNYRVKSINAATTWYSRKSNPTVTKTDEIDARIIAKNLLDNLDSLRDATNDEIYWTLKQLIGMRKSLSISRIHYLNKLHSQLLHHYPNYQEMFVNLHCKTSMLFFSKFPSPNMLKNITVDELSDKIKTPTGKNKHKVTAKKLLDIISEYDIEHSNYQEERNYIIKMLFRQLKNSMDKLEEIEKEITTIYNKIGSKLHTLKGLDVVSAAVILAEIGNIKRFNSASALARYAGIAPNQFSSGSSTNFVNNRYGNRDLNTLIYFLAVRSICPSKTKLTPHNAIFIEYFNKKVSEGKTRKQALVCVMRRLINIIYGILKNNTEYYHPYELETKSKQQYQERIINDNQKQLNDDEVVVTNTIC